MDQGILVIRFEMPFNVWCNGCGHLIGKGVRFNAEKKAIGNYYSTKIWSFSMTSPCCQEHIEVQTDPKNHEYIVVAGARRKVRSLSYFFMHCREASALQPSSHLAALMQLLTCWFCVRAHLLGWDGLQACSTVLAHAFRTRGQEIMTAVLTSAATHMAQAESYTAADAETMELPDKEEEGAAQAQPDPFARLEKGVEDRRRGREGAERIAELREDSAAKYKDDYTINKALRRQLRYVLSASIECPHQQAYQMAVQSF